MIKSKKKKTELSFGQYFKKLRIGNKQTLRGFCLENKYNASNVSKLERGVLSAPSNKKLKNYAKALHIKEGSNAWIQFFDLASISRKTIKMLKIKISLNFYQYSFEQRMVEI